MKKRLTEVQIIGHSCAKSKRVERLYANAALHVQEDAVERKASLGHPYRNAKFNPTPKISIIGVRDLCH